MTVSRVLVVDDEVNLRSTLADILEDEGYEVDTAESAEQALESCAQTAYDVVIMDMRMPGLSGVEAMQTLRASGASARVILKIGRAHV